LFPKYCALEIDLALANRFVASPFEEIDDEAFVLFEEYFDLRRKDKKKEINND
jgi:hypothetical protein